MTKIEIMNFFLNSTKLHYCDIRLLKYLAIKTKGDFPCIYNI